MGILKIKGIPKLVVFGGYSHVNDTYPSIVEVWNDDTETWHIFTFNLFLLIALPRLSKLTKVPNYLDNDSGHWLSLDYLHRKS